MPSAVNTWLGQAAIAVCALIVLAIGAAACFYAGFAWSILICGFIGWLIGQKAVAPNEQLETAILVLCCWILLAVGVFVGLVLRLVLL